MPFELPQIVKLAERLLVDIEQAVQRFHRSHKYASGAELRSQAMNVARCAHRAWRDRAHVGERVTALAYAIDDLKLTMQLAKRVEAFASFRQFEALARVAGELGRMCGGWKKHLHGQSAAAAQRPPQRPETLSTRAASRGAHR